MTLIAQGVADQLAGRVAFRRAMKRAVQNAQNQVHLEYDCNAPEDLVAQKCQDLNGIEKAVCHCIHFEQILTMALGSSYNIWANRSQGLDISWRYSSL